MARRAAQPYDARPLNLSKDARVDREINPFLLSFSCHQRDCRRHPMLLRLPLAEVLAETLSPASERHRGVQVRLFVGGMRRFL